MSVQNGAIYILDGCIVFAADKLVNELFTDYPISVILGVDADVTLDYGDTTQAARGFAVRQGVKRRLESEHAVVDFLIGLDSDYYRYLSQHFETEETLVFSAEDLAAVQPQLQRLVAVDVASQDVSTTVKNILQTVLGSPAEMSPIDARLQPVLDYLQKELPTNPPIADLAEMACLSQSRLMHLFKQQLGLPIRQFLLWKKLESAAKLHAQGLSLSDVAAEAGFYDQAHFTRTVRRMLDLPPSVVTNSRNIQAILCEAK